MNEKTLQTAECTRTQKTKSAFLPSVSRNRKIYVRNKFHIQVILIAMSTKGPASPTTSFVKVNYYYT